MLAGDASKLVDWLIYERSIFRCRTEMALLRAWDAACLRVVRLLP